MHNTDHTHLVGVAVGVELVRPLLLVRLLLLALPVVLLALPVVPAVVKGGGWWEGTEAPSLDGQGAEAVADLRARCLDAQVLLLLALPRSLRQRLVPFEAVVGMAAGLDEVSEALCGRDEVAVVPPLFAGGVYDVFWFGRGYMFDRG